MSLKFAARKNLKAKAIEVFEVDGPVQLTMNLDAFVDEEDCLNCAEFIADMMTKAQMWNPNNATK